MTRALGDCCDGGLPMSFDFGLALLLFIELDLAPCYWLNLRIFSLFMLTIMVPPGVPRSCGQRKVTEVVILRRAHEAS
jgi:hypothetical protein